MSELAPYLLIEDVCCRKTQQMSVEVRTSQSFERDVLNCRSRRYAGADRTSRDVQAVFIDLDLGLGTVHVVEMVAVDVGRPSCPTTDSPTFYVVFSKQWLNPAAGSVAEPTCQHFSAMKIKTMAFLALNR